MSRAAPEPESKDQTPKRDEISSPKRLKHSLTQLPPIGDTPFLEIFAFLCESRQKLLKGKRDGASVRALNHAPEDISLYPFIVYWLQRLDQEEICFLTLQTVIFSLYNWVYDIKPPEAETKYEAEKLPSSFPKTLMRKMLINFFLSVYADKQSNGQYSEESKAEAHFNLFNNLLLHLQQMFVSTIDKLGKQHSAPFTYLYLLGATSRFLRQASQQFQTFYQSPNQNGKQTVAKILHQLHPSSNEFIEERLLFENEASAAQTQTTAQAIADITPSVKIHFEQFKLSAVQPLLDSLKPEINGIPCKETQNDLGQRVTQLSSKLTAANIHETYVEIAFLYYDIVLQAPIKDVNQKRRLFLEFLSDHQLLSHFSDLAICRLYYHISLNAVASRQPLFMHKIQPNLYSEIFDYMIRDLKLSTTNLQKDPEQFPPRCLDRAGPFMGYNSQYLANWLANAMDQMKLMDAFSTMLLEFYGLLFCIPPFDNGHAMTQIDLLKTANLPNAFFTTSENLLFGEHHSARMLQRLWQSLFSTLPKQEFQLKMLASILAHFPQVYENLFGGIHYEETQSSLRQNVTQFSSKLTAANIHETYVEIVFLYYNIVLHAPIKDFDQKRRLFLKFLSDHQLLSHFSDLAICRLYYHISLNAVASRQPLFMHEIQPNLYSEIFGHMVRDLTLSAADLQKNQEQFSSRFLDRAGPFMSYSQHLANWLANAMDQTKLIDACSVMVLEFYDLIFCMPPFDKDHATTQTHTIEATDQANAFFTSPEDLLFGEHHSARMLQRLWQSLFSDLPKEAFQFKMLASILVHFTQVYEHLFEKDLLQMPSPPGAHIFLYLSNQVAIWLLINNNQLLENPTAGKKALRLHLSTIQSNEYIEMIAQDSGVLPKTFKPVEKYALLYLNLSTMINQLTDHSIKTDLRQHLITLERTINPLRKEQSYLSLTRCYFQYIALSRKNRRKNFLNFLTGNNIMSEFNTEESVSILYNFATSPYDNDGNRLFTGLLTNPSNRGKKDKQLLALCGKQLKTILQIPAEEKRDYTHSKNPLSLTLYFQRQHAAASFEASIAEDRFSNAVAAEMIQTQVQHRQTIDADGDTDSSTDDSTEHDTPPGFARLDDPIESELDTDEAKEKPWDTDSRIPFLLFCEHQPADASLSASEADDAFFNAVAAEMCSLKKP